ncbi:MAG: hydroxymethylglutaryl-CoA lyase [Flavobacteriales bacterium]|nr:hydroxymethylglutaryl-CoA lyase [Flavobacteriales bacterium]|tara:strand:+ start:9381 stop:10232 length:852 start_codon:yes stop_codon:yes gene_type:complete
MNNQVRIIECPRDAMQGLSEFIPTRKKADYINSLIKVGFDMIDFGSFVSHKAVPQMRDTSELVNLLNLEKETTLLSVILNKRGALAASSFEQIKILGYPLSISEIFQKKNSNKDISSSLSVVDEIQNICLQKNKTLLVYLSMAFGNPYNEKWDKNILFDYILKIQNKNIHYISLADTIGNSNTNLINSIYTDVKQNFPDLDIGLHLHSSPEQSYEKLHAAWSSGCKRFDVSINGYGGCPFAQNELVGNISTQTMINFLVLNKIQHSLDLLAFENACNYAKDIF